MTATDQIARVEAPRKASSPLRVRAAIGALGAAVAGVAPHVLHHVGPLAGAALFAGVGGTLLFGVLGFVLAIPMLRKIHRHTGSLRAPAAALAVMAAVFTFSSFVIGPAISGEPAATQPTPTAEPGHGSHH